MRMTAATSFSSHNYREHSLLFGATPRQAQQRICQHFFELACSTNKTLI
jgi:hypothetical protein